MRDALIPLPGTTLDTDDYVGGRVARNRDRLLEVDLERLLAPFEHRPGMQPWIGEHLGKWLHAATPTWRDTGDPALAARMELAACRLVATQEPDGYLGTYEPGRRLGSYADADWDVWTHKYCMIGLIACYRALGDERAPAASVRAADLLAATFGDEAGQRSIVAGAWHMDMAASSVLEPVVQLYQLTGSERFVTCALLQAF